MFNGQRDAALRLETFIPAAGNAVVVTALDIGVSTSGFSNQWRQGFLRITWPALPNHTNASLNITATLVDSGDSGASFQSGADGGARGILPVVQVLIPGVAVNGAPAGYSDIPCPPGTRGPVGFSLASPAGGGDNTGALVTCDWYDG